MDQGWPPPSSGGILRWAVAMGEGRCALVGHGEGSAGKRQASSSSMSQRSPARIQPGLRFDHVVEKSQAGNRRLTSNLLRESGFRPSGIEDREHMRPRLLRKWPSSSSIPQIVHLETM